MGHWSHLLVFILLSFSLRCESSWGWFSSSKETPSSDRSYANEGTFRGSSAEFSIEGFNNQRGMKLVENAKKKMVGSNTCWQLAYQHLFAGCSEILAADEKRSRLAWHLSDCFQRDSGRLSFPHCDPKSSMATCLRTLDDLAHKVYLEFYLETNSICYQLQAHAFKHETERLVTELKSSAQYAEDKLDSIEEKSEQLLHGSKQIHDSLNSIDIYTQQVAQTAKSVESHIDVVLRHSESVYEQTTKIAASQSQLKEGQEDMKRNLEEGVAMLKDSYNNLGKEIEMLRDEAIEIENEVIKVGDAMSSKMSDLQIKAEDIGNMAGISLGKQQQLLDGQSTALKGLDSLNEFQSKALEESRKTLQYFAEYGHRQHEELLQRQEQIKGLHDCLMENSKSILSAQESFESKQATMFIALDKIFALQNAMLLESRMIKAFFIYSISIFVIFMLTSTKQTYNVRHLLYIGLCATFFMEVFIIRLTSDNIEQQTWIINLLRLFFMVAASVQLVYAICTYRNYELLNHHMLLTLINKVNSMQKQKELSWDMDTDYDVDWSQWVDTDLPDDVNCLDDPDFILPEKEGQNSITASANTKCYNLRSRNRFH
ncbi:protein GAMETE EXPRESSED 1-like [Gastrolobium bilobum]|uniref:protein GAMETE EXPRESSED 1-like n=1 Tax=Gastrolobium bilobum TaxID=150636 RepID=UPI002AB148DC|nr:protein GAMETE EXPRESSED 1-like [Gastrolobium bilobum]